MRELKKEELEYAIGRLDVYMTSRGLNQSDLEELSGVEQSTISKILHRKQEPSLDNLQKLFGGLGLQLVDVLTAAAERLPKVLQGYLATPLTGLTDQEDATVRDVVDAVRRCSSTFEFSTPPINVYWPGEHTHPKRHPNYKASTVYLIDRSRASTFHFLVILCGMPSYGVGQENEIATQAGVPAIRLVNSQVSRMMVGSFVKNFDVQYTGTLKEGSVVAVEEQEPPEVLRIVARHCRKESVELVVSFGEQRSICVGEDAGKLANLPVQHCTAAIVENDGKRELAQRLTVAESAEAVTQVLDVGLLRFVNELVSLWDLLVPRLGDEPRLRNVEVPATGVDLFPGLRHRHRHPLGHDIEVRGDFEELIQYKGPRLADCFLHGEDTDEMVTHS
jgi:transcriptional regulator with XRE-family HTH domain